ncbi:hypothetical protein DFH01_04960 [Falsiroseomonas bella]|uniref:PEP-CTERM protein-sorting domain-containing protein n=1 Tax=Falsiroseomonas bella TaxID=2184016 RepID=A0A317FIP0_9PROT|nr:hypothetical protein [Falsiroseomonas bella]PWS38625.1 hypothetical protein DFH01_04960 [Falsiroseomonas bella]
MLRLRRATIALALGTLLALAAPAMAGRIAHDDVDLILLAEGPANPEQMPGADRMELVANASEAGEMKTASAVAVAAPAPAALAVFGIGLLGLAAVRRIRRR